MSGKEKYIEYKARNIEDKNEGMSEWTYKFYKILNIQINIATWRLITFEIKLWKVLYQFIGWKDAFSKPEWTKKAC